MAARRLQELMWLEKLLPAMTSPVLLRKIPKFCLVMEATSTETGTLFLDIMRRIQQTYCVMAD